MLFYFINVISSETLPIERMHAEKKDCFYGLPVISVITTLEIHSLAQLLSSLVVMTFVRGIDANFHIDCNVFCRECDAA